MTIYKRVGHSLEPTQEGAVVTYDPHPLLAKWDQCPYCIGTGKFLVYVLGEFLVTDHRCKYCKGKNKK